jgi:RNA polymerase sigma-70 factor (ECF subfamily)
MYGWTYMPPTTSTLRISLEHKGLSKVKPGPAEPAEAVRAGGKPRKDRAEELADLKLAAAAAAQGTADLAWVVQVREGDETAARALVERLYPTIMRTVRSHLPRRTHEEDLAQAIYTKVFHKLEQFSGLAPLEHWAARIAINTCLNQLKHEAARPEVRMGDLSEEEEAVIQQLARTAEDPPNERRTAARELLETLLKRLRPDEQRVIRLLYVEEWSTQEISRQTGWSVSLVKVKAFRTRQKMRKLWDTLFRKTDPCPIT